MSRSGEQMDLTYATWDIADEDRISILPPEMIHRILSYIDTRNVVQTSALSRRWKQIWNSIPYLNLNSNKFSSPVQFNKFIKDLLTYRDENADLSHVELAYRGEASLSRVKEVIDYACLLRVQNITLKWLTNAAFHFPGLVFHCMTLKHLTLASGEQSRCHVPNYAWDLPHLETLKLSTMRLCDTTDTSLDLFSKCRNLKDIILELVSTPSLALFIVNAAKLSNLTVKHFRGAPDVFKVVAPQLENVTLCIGSWGFGSLVFTDDLASLQRVYLSIVRTSYPDDTYVGTILDLFQKLHNAQVLILDKAIVEALSSWGELARTRCPFKNLKLLKTDKQKHLLVTLPPQVIDYFFASSPTATLITDLAQVKWKRSTEVVEKDNTTKKVVELENENRVQAEVIAQQNAMLKELRLYSERAMSGIIKSEMEKLLVKAKGKLLVKAKGGNMDVEFVRSMGDRLKSLTYQTPEILKGAVKEDISRQYLEMKQSNLTCLDDSEWARLETELLITSESDVSSEVKTCVKTVAQEFLEKAGRELLGGDKSFFKGPLKPQDSDDDDMVVG